MANHNAYYNMNYLSTSKMNKVYINPNFNRPDTALNSSRSMHVNPNFSIITSNMYNHSKQDTEPQHTKTKIHVNPNFIRSANLYNVANNPELCVIKPPTYVPLPIKDNSVCKQVDIQTSSRHVTKSRYSFVRQKDNTITNSLISKPVTKTVRVNKYKSVALNVVKNILANEKTTKNSTVSSLSQNVKYKPKVLNVNNTRFKYVRSNPASALKQPEKKVTKYFAARRTSLTNMNLIKVTPKINNQLKKNNIPCRLFKKYGICIRKVKGNCHFLHDKKHVSICRKFLRGICHNADCLLSHDLTDKKMPTCYFYLQGACTKESCPYLHVKHNEKTKICQDFLRGYCENGDKCLFRHVNVCQSAGSNQVSLKKPLPGSPSKSNSAAKVKNRKKFLVMVGQEHKHSMNKVEDGGTKDKRYFKELGDKSLDINCDMIKPSRIKLGTLPSFIQL